MQILRSPVGAIGFFFFFFFFLYIIIFFFFFFMSLPGRQIYIFLTLIFFFQSFPGASNFNFLTSRKLDHMKFAICDVARCRMSATSLTFLFEKYSHAGEAHLRKPLHPFLGILEAVSSAEPAAHKRLTCWDWESGHLILQAPIFQEKHLSIA